jgi:23S rRNA pseudouridine2605 synthase
MAERLQKWLAARGHGSRRKIEALIREGRIEVDGEVAELGRKVGGGERILIDGKPVRRARDAVASRVLIYHKPPGEICTRDDPQGRPTIFSALPKVVDGRWVSVGRLDYQTAGLLLVTTDGELANRLMHPSSRLPREYVVRALGELSAEQSERLHRGILLDDGEARFESIELTGGEGANRSYRVVVTEGRNRIVRRLFDAVGCKVNRLLRVRYGPIRLPRELRPGEYRELGDAEIRQLESV